MPAQAKSYWQTMYLGDDRARETCRSWFAPLADDMTPHKAEILCDIETDREKKLRAFMKDSDGAEFKFERTMGQRFSIRRVRL